MEKEPIDSFAAFVSIFYASLAFLIPFIFVWLFCEHLFKINQAVHGKMMECDTNLPLYC